MLWVFPQEGLWSIVSLHWVMFTPNNYIKSWYRLGDHLQIITVASICYSREYWLFYLAETCLITTIMNILSCCWWTSYTRSVLLENSMIKLVHQLDQPEKTWISGWFRVPRSHTFSTHTECFCVIFQVRFLCFLYEGLLS